MRAKSDRGTSCPTEHGMRAKWNFFSRLDCATPADQHAKSKRKQENCAEGLNLQHLTLHLLRLVNPSMTISNTNILAILLNKRTYLGLKEVRYSRAHFKSGKGEANISSAQRSMMLTCLF